MSDSILTALDVSQMAISCIESHMCSSEDNKCDKLNLFLKELYTTNSKLLAFYENNDENNDEVKTLCSNVHNLWESIKSLHSTIILTNLINQYTGALDDPDISSDDAMVDEITKKLNKFSDLHSDIESGKEITNNTYHILLELQESLY